jgi:hypothetical protein
MIRMSLPLRTKLNVQRNEKAVQVEVMRRCA